MKHTMKRALALLIAVLLAMPSFAFAEEPMELRLTHIDENGKIFWWEDTKTRNRYPMRGTEFNKLLAQGIKQTLVRGVWSAQKRGYALGITLVSCDERRFEEAQQMRQP